jgi:EpsI family protein
MISRNARFATVAALLAGAALFLQARARHGFAPPRIVLASFPRELKNWAGMDVPILDEDLKTLGPGEFLQRTYKNQTIGGDDVDLYLAYFPSRSDALYKHLPQNCLIDSGWSLVESGTTSLSLPGDAPFVANRYLIARGADRQLVLFWYSAYGRRVASESRIDFRLLLDSLRLNRSDNALIRLNTGLLPGEKPDDAERRLLAFAELVNPLLNNYIPR